MRSTLVAPLLHHVRANLHRQVEQVRLFEVAHVFREEKEGELPEERLNLVAMLSETTEDSLWSSAARGAPLFFEMKGIAERLFAGLGLDVRFASETSAPYLHPGIASDLQLDGSPIGAVGEIHPETAVRLDIERRCAVLEVDLAALLTAPAQEISYREVSRHPSVRRDLAVVLSAEQPAGEVVEAIRRQGGEALLRVELFDRYEGEGVEAGKVSLAFRLVYQRTDRTLTDAEVTKATDRVVKMLSHRFGGELR